MSSDAHILVLWSQRRYIHCLWLCPMHWQRHYLSQNNAHFLRTPTRTCKESWWSAIVVGFARFRLLKCPPRHTYWYCEANVVTYIASDYAQCIDKGIVADDVYGICHFCIHFLLKVGVAQMTARPWNWHETFTCEVSHIVLVGTYLYEQADLSKNYNYICVEMCGGQCQMSHKKIHKHMEDVETAIGKGRWFKLGEV